MTILFVSKPVGWIKPHETREAFKGSVYDSCLDLRDHPGEYV